MLESRKLPILIFIYTISLIFIFRLFYLQILDEKYRGVGALNSVRKEVQIPLRGQIYDKNNQLIVANEEVYDMYVIPKKVNRFDTTAFCDLLNINWIYLDSMLQVAKDFSPVKGSLFLRQLSKSEYAGIIDAIIHYPGFYFEQSFYRTYPGNTMANALGYIGEISREQYESQVDNYYRKGDYIGLSGLERYYENDLRGIKGSKLILVNSRMEDKGPYEGGRLDSASVIGKNLYTHIDLGVQQLADTLFTGKTGAIVAIEPATGGIIAMGSYPTYSPELLSGREFSSNYARLVVNPDKPLINRAVFSFYRPGSTFKLVQAAIGLGDGVITPQTSLIGNSRFSAHSAGEGSNLYMAIQKSSNPYFDNVMRRIVHNNQETDAYKRVKTGLNHWNNQLFKFGFGIKLGIDLPSEGNDLIPTVARYDKMYGKKGWTYSTIYSISIGEGEYGVNVLKLANMAAVFANRGYWMTPHLVKGVGWSSSKLELNTEVYKHETQIAAEHFDTIVKGMELVVNAGTGRSAQVKDVIVCGKTGTIQNKNAKDTSLFIAFAPKDNPKIAVAVVVENGGYGATAAAPIAGMLIEKYLKGHHNRDYQKEQIMNTHYITSFASSSRNLK